MKNTNGACTQVKGATPINYHLKSEVSITLHCQLCLTGYTAVKICNYSKSTSVIKVATMKISVMQRKPSCGTTKSILFAVS